jgi:uncharacterized protein (DUF2267 family)
MSATRLEVFDSTVQQTYEWLRDIEQETGWEDHQQAYLSLRGTLHALRDHLTVDEGAQLAAQLPMLIRGIYYEGWDPSRVPLHERHREQFLQRVAAAFHGSRPVNVEKMARAVLTVLARRITRGEADDVRRMLPSEIRELWPATVHWSCDGPWGRE